MSRTLQNAIYVSNFKRSDLKIIDNVIITGSSSTPLKTQSKLCFLTAEFSAYWHSGNTQLVSIKISNDKIFSIINHIYQFIYVNSYSASGQV